MVGVSPGLRFGIESGRVSVVALEATRTAKLLSSELLAAEPLCSQSTSSHAKTSDLGDRLLGTSRTVLIRQIVLLVALTFIAIAFCSAQGPDDSLRKPPLPKRREHSARGSLQQEVFPAWRKTASTGKYRSYRSQRPSTGLITYCLGQAPKQNRVSALAIHQQTSSNRFDDTLKNATSTFRY